MIETTQSVFADIARLRWPNATRVCGEGQFAIVVRCAGRPDVHLFTNRSDAFKFYKEQCNAGCKHSHAWVELKPPAPRYVKKPHWHRLIDLPR